MVKLKSFRRVTHNDAQIEPVCVAVEAEANAFLATLNPLDVLDVGKTVTAVGKTVLTFVEIWVTYRG